MMILSDNAITVDMIQCTQLRADRSFSPCLNLIILITILKLLLWPLLLKGSAFLSFLSFWRLCICSSYNAAFTWRVWYDGLTLQCLQALARLDVPDLDSGVCVARDQDVVLQLHATGEGLVPRQRVDAVARLHVPDPYRCVQWTAHHMNPIKLESRA